MISCVLLLFGVYCFGIYTPELLFIGYSIIGHILLITMVFLTKVFSHVRLHSPPSPPNKVKMGFTERGLTFSLKSDINIL